MVRTTHQRQLKIGDITPDKKNANRGTSRGRELLRESLTEHGAGRSILIDRRARIIAGHKTFEQAKLLGLPIQVVTTNGTALVVVRRKDLDLERDPAARALAIRDNRIAELDLAWDPTVLEELRNQGLDLGTLWTDREWEELVGQESSPDPNEDKPFEPRPTTIQRGDLFALGPHRILCGDATSPQDVSTICGETVPVVMVTDPPYGVHYDPAHRHRAYPGQRTAVGRVLNDDRADWSAAFQLFAGDVLYVWHAGIRSGPVATAVLAAGFEIRAQIVWAKQHFALSRGNYHYQHEPAFYCVRRGRSARWRGDRTQTTLWTVPNLNPMGGTRTGEDTPSGHSTQKPVRLFEIPIRNHTTAGEAIYDPFVGSGTTLIAAEKLGRVALVMDLEPKYVQAALDRWEAFTKQRATRLTKRIRSRS